MPYDINKTNGTLLTVVQDGTVDNTTDLVFIGKNYTGYGDPVNENFVRLLENFANYSAPKKPLTGQLWYDTSSKKIKLYNGSRFKPIALISTGTAFPVDAIVGDFHFNGSLLLTYTGKEWLPIGPSVQNTSDGSALPLSSILSQEQTINPAVSLTINGNSALVISTASAYSVYASDPFYNNYPAIYPGVNIPDTDANGISAYYDTEFLGNLMWGTAASAIGIVDYSNNTKKLIKASDLVLQSDITTLNNPLSINSDDGITINNAFRLHITRNQAVAESNISNIANSIIKFNINTLAGGTYTNFLNLDGTNGVFQVLPTTSTAVSLGSSNTGSSFDSLYVTNIRSTLVTATNLSSTNITASNITATNLSVSTTATFNSGIRIASTSTINGAAILTTATLNGLSQIPNDVGYLTSSTVGQYSVRTLTGTVNQISVSTATGNVVVSLPTTVSVTTLTSQTLYADSNMYVKVGGIYSPVLTAASFSGTGITIVSGTANQITANTTGTQVTLSLPSDIQVSILRASALYDSGNRVLTEANGVRTFSAGTTGFTPFGSVSGNITLGGVLNVSNGGTGASTLAAGYLVRGNGTSALSSSVIYDSGTNIGIGTSSPGYRLDIVSNETSPNLGYAVRIRSNATALASSIQFSNNGATIQNGLISFTDSGVGTFQADGASSALVLRTNGSERLRINSSGNVGIGTSSPGTPLDVVTSSGLTGIRVRANSSNTQAVIQFTDNAGSSQWSNITVTASTTTINDDVVIKGNLKYGATTQVEPFHHVTPGFLGGSVYVSTSTPSSPSIGDIWLEI